MPSIQFITLPQNFRLDHRGWSFAPFRNLESIHRTEVDWNSFHAVSLEPGTIRGNHVHPETTEWLFFCGGPIRLAWEEAGSLRPRTTLIDNHHTLVIIPPGVGHAVKNESPGTVYLIAFRSPVPSAEGIEVMPSKLID